MDSITRTRLANNASSTQTEKEQPQQTVKRTAPKGTKRGAFIVVDNLIDGKK